jgi:potassium/chloride transporter 9
VEKPTARGFLFLSPCLIHGSCPTGRDSTTTPALARLQEQTEFQQHSAESAPWSRTSIGSVTLLDLSYCLLSLIVGRGKWAEFAICTARMCSNQQQAQQDTPTRSRRTSSHTMTGADDGAQAIRQLPTRTRSNFAARTARDENARLHRRSFAQHSPPLNEETPLLPERSELLSQEGLIYDGAAADDQGTHSFLSRVRAWFKPLVHSARSQASTNEAPKPRPGAFPRPVGGKGKLGTFAGVFVPVTLNVLSILMFLRFGFILGQAGLVGMMGMLVAGYSINLLTTMSISAIATNGTVRGGGAYYLISRSLGPEFGGSIGIVFYLGTVFSTSLNAVGLIDCLIVNFGNNGAMGQWLPQSYWWQFLWATMVLATCTLVCLAGSGLFARASNGLLLVLLLAILSIPVSAALRDPFADPRENIIFTGFSMSTLRQNLLPHFTKGAAGSAIKGHEGFQDLFGILFPATGGILA